MSKRYHIELDYNGYLLEPGSFRITESPLFGTKFTTGRTSYSSLDFWQTGGMTDFTHGMGQEFLSDPSAFQFSVGVDVSQPGKFFLEKDLKAVGVPEALTEVSASYATLNKLYIGTSIGQIFSTSDGINWVQESLPITSGKIYSFYELKGKLFALKGANKQLKLENNQWSETNVQQAYFCSVQDDVGYMIFNGYEVRITEDGETFAPAFDQEPLFRISQGDGEILNIASLPTRRLFGTAKTLYVHIGGSSGVKLHNFPALKSDNNFRGMTSWVSLGLFSIENFGIFYSEGSGIYPTNINYLNQFFKFKSCYGITTILNDVYTLIEDSTTNYYLARACLNYMGAPSYFWLVKKLNKQPAHITSFNKKLFIFYKDGTAEEIDSKYQTSGYLISPRIDCDLVLIQKYFRSVSATMEPLPENTSVDIKFVLNESKSNSNFANWTSETFTRKGTTRAGFTLPNPSIGQEIKVGVKLNTTDTTKTPVVTDILWTYFLEHPEGQSITKSFHGTIIAEDNLEKLDGEVYDPGHVKGKTRQQIIDSLWNSAMKKQLLNFVGPDNVESPAIYIKHPESSSKVKVDATNNYLIFSTGQYIDYSGMTLEELVIAINKITGFEASLHPQANKDEPSESLMPVIDLECKNNLLLYTGTDIHSVIFAEGGIGQLKLAFEDPGSDRIQISLREAL